MFLKRAAVVAGLASGLMSGTAHASYVININQVGSDVVATGSGSIDLAGFTYAISTPGGNGAVDPSRSAIAIGAGSADAYFGPINGPDNFGSGHQTQADAGLGALFGFVSGLGAVFVPSGYESGTLLGLSTATFSNATLASLGLTSGQYTYVLGGPLAVEFPGGDFKTAAFDGEAIDFDTITLNIGGVSAVPLPSSAPMFGAALLALGMIGYGVKRKKAAAAAAA